MINILITSGGGIWIPRLAKLLQKNFNVFLTDSRKINKPKYVKKVFKVNLPKYKNIVEIRKGIITPLVSAKYKTINVERK